MVENGLTHQQSIDCHQDSFGCSFDIHADSAPVHTGCLGFGLEWLAFALSGPFGVDEHSWPAWIAAR